MATPSAMRKRRRQSPLADIFTRSSPSRTQASRWKTRITTIAAAAALSIFAACNSSEEGSPVPIDDLARLMADAICNNIGPCCREAGFAHEPAQCHARAVMELQSDIDESRTQPNRAYDAAAARACVDARASAVKACTEDRATEAACRSVFVGTLQAGQTCSHGSECAPDLYCETASDGSGMHCAINPLSVHGKLGDSCSANCTPSENGGICSTNGTGGPGGQVVSGTAACFTNEGLYCGITRTCATIPVIGEPCAMSTVPCTDDAYCDNGVCAARRTSGPCMQYDTSCAATAYCDPSRLQCVLRKSTGEACTTTIECPNGTICEGTCRARTLASAAICMGNL
jgi:hypothetical protein